METVIKGLRTNRAFAITTVLVLLLLLTAVAAPILAPYDPTEATMRNAYLPPSAEHLFGTDKLGRDCLSRVLYGARASLSGVLLLVTTVQTTRLLHTKVTVHQVLLLLLKLLQITETVQPVK